MDFTPTNPKQELMEKNTFYSLKKKHTFLYKVMRLGSSKGK
jgi:hypothetical protein